MEEGGGGRAGCRRTPPWHEQSVLQHSPGAALWENMGRTPEFEGHIGFLNQSLQQNGDSMSSLNSGHV